MDIQNKKVAFIGCGAMGGALVTAIAKVVSPSNIFICDHNTDKLERLSAKTGAIAVAGYTELLAKKADFLFLATKPPYICQILSDLCNSKIKLSSPMPSVIISIAAGITLDQLQKAEPQLSSNTTFVRLMPNTPAQIGEGMIALSVSDTSKNDAVANQVKALMAKAGITEQVPENLMNAVTAISGSGPAYVYMFIEALADAAVAFGMPRAKAYTFAAQTVKGSAAMVITTDLHPGVLKDTVCSPAGTTIAAVEALESAGLRPAVQKGARAAFIKSCEMSKKS